MKRRITAAALLAEDLAACVILGFFWLITGGWRTIPRHDEDACWDCQHGYTCDRTAVVL